jgi:hypothetical protein
MYVVAKVPYRRFCELGNTSMAMAQMISVMPDKASSRGAIASSSALKALPCGHVLIAW